MTEHKEFMSTIGDIRVADIAGNVAIITNIPRSLPNFLWGLAYGAGAISTDMKDDSLSSHIASKKQEQIDAALEERNAIKASLLTIYGNPVSVIDGKGNIIHRKAIAVIGRPVKKDIIDSIWKEILEEKAGE